MNSSWIEKLFLKSPLIPAIAQDFSNNQVLMLAWMNKAALFETVISNRAVYWSRSRSCLWKKGERSGHIQHVHEILLDCDSDSLLLKVEQYENIACHTGRTSCFFKKLTRNSKSDVVQWIAMDNVLKEERLIYK